MSLRRILLALLASAVGMLGLAAPASAFTETFQYTGGSQQWTVPAGVTVATFDLYGAQGAGGNDTPGFEGGLGGRAIAPIAVTPGASIQVNVGGAGGHGLDSTGGFNGGGNGGIIDNGAFGGGGASDVRIGGTALANRVLVAGGGGGAAPGAVCNQPATGGAGGGLSGSPGNGCPQFAIIPGGGGAQSAGGGSGGDPSGQSGTFGVGGAGGATGNGGGGGGWYGGGGGGGGSGGSGGGGSGHGPDGTVFETGVRSGDGFATVSYAPTIDTLIERVGVINPPPTLKNGLLQKLNAAKQNPDAACRQLAAFITQVTRQSGTKIPTPDADQLTAEAEEVRDSLNCGAAVGSCAGREATIVGTDRADKLRGTKGQDVIAAGGGEDRVVGLRGDDLVCGGSGADVIRGGRGDDTLRGGGGNDELRGSRGSDRCRGGAGSDSNDHC